MVNTLAGFGRTWSVQHRGGRTGLECARDSTSAGAIMSEARISSGSLEAVRVRELDRYAASRPLGQHALQRARAHMPKGVPMAWMSSLYGHPPPFVRAGVGVRFTDLDGYSYVDFNLADTSMFAGYGVAPITEAVTNRFAGGPHFLLPTVDSITVAEELCARWAMPYWQFTLSATQANTEAIRICRAITGRDRVLMFDGKYHGHADEFLGAVDESGNVVPEGRGIVSDATRHVTIVPYNDLGATDRQLQRGEFACVVVEPAITNAGVILPKPSFHAELRRLVSDVGALLIVDETHTLVCGPGGLTRQWGLHPDVVVLGKSISGGLPLGAYGMTERVAESLEDPSGGWADTIATGGTLFANALSMAAARVALQQVLTPGAYRHAAALGGRLADGIESTATELGLDWRAHRLFNRSGYTHGPDLPRSAADARNNFDASLFNTQRVYMANRGIWEAIESAGPAAGIRSTDADVDRYVNVLHDFLSEVVH